MGFSFDIQTWLFHGKMGEFGDRAIGEVAYIIATCDKTGRRWREPGSTLLVGVDESEDGFGYSYDADPDSIRIERLYDRVEILRGSSPGSDWREIQPAYGSAAWEAWAAEEDYSARLYGGD